MVDPLRPEPPALPQMVRRQVAYSTQEVEREQRLGQQLLARALIEVDAQARLMQGRALVISSPEDAAAAFGYYSEWHLWAKAWFASPRAAETPAIFSTTGA